MRWPFWFPYPGAFAYCLLMLVLVSISAVLVGPIVWALMLLTLGGSALADVLTGDAAVAGFVLLVGLPLIAVVDSLFLAYGYQLVSYIVQRLAKKSPELHPIPPWKFWQDAFFANATFSVGAVLAFGSVGLITCDDGFCRDYLTEAEVGLIGAAAFVLMVYCYHLRMLRREWVARRKKRKQNKRRQQNVEANRASLPRVKPRQKPRSKRPQKPKSSPPPSVPKDAPSGSSIDDELEQIKRQMEGRDD